MDAKKVKGMREKLEPILVTAFPNTPLEDFENMLDVLRDAPMIAWDVETTSVNDLEAELVGISFSEGCNMWYVPVGHLIQVAERSIAGQQLTIFSEPEDSKEPVWDLDPRQLPIDYVLERVKPLLESDQPKKSAYHAKYDIGVMRRYGVFAKNHMDPIVFRYLYYNGSAHAGFKGGLKAEVSSIFDYEMQNIETLIGEKPTGRYKNDPALQQKPFSQVPIEDAYPYAADDAYFTWMLAKYWYAKYADKPQGLPVGTIQLSMHLEEEMVAMRHRGVTLDVEYFKDLHKTYEAEVRPKLELINDLAGYRVNLNSSQQLNKLFFEDQGLDPSGLKTTSTGMVSMAKGEMEKLFLKYPENQILQHISRLKRLQYGMGLIQGYLKVMDEHHRLHTYWAQWTSSGRFTSSAPNLMNIPAHSSVGTDIRKGFIPRPGNVFIGADYSQLELRILAHVAEDPNLVKAYINGEDVHTLTAAEVFSILRNEEIEPGDVSKSMRNAAKSVNFGLVYGMGAGGLAANMGMTLKEAEAFIEVFFQLRSNVKYWIEQTRKFVLTHGYTESIGGRRRYFHDLKDPKVDMHSGYTWHRLNAAVNHCIQGSGADIMKAAMSKLPAKLDPLNAWQVLQIHDELIVEGPEEQGEAIAKVVETTMSSSWNLRVPLVAEALIGKNLYEVKG